MWHGDGASEEVWSCGRRASRPPFRRGWCISDLFEKKCRRRQNRPRGFVLVVPSARLLLKLEGRSRDGHSQQVVAGGHNQAE